MQTISTKNWRCDLPLTAKLKPSNEIRCCHKSKMEMGEKYGCIGAINSITFNDEEKDVMPDSASVSNEFKVKCFMESGRKICFFPSDIGKQRWSNNDVNNLKNKRSSIL